MTTMTDEDIRKIRGVVREEIGDALKPVNERLDALWDQTAKLTEDMAEVQVTLKFHSKTLKHHSQILEKLDRSSEHQADKVDRLEKRVIQIEDKTGIVPPIELVTLK